MEGVRAGAEETAAVMEAGGCTSHTTKEISGICLYENYQRTVEPEAPNSRGASSFINDGVSVREYLGGGDLGGGGGEGGGGLGGGGDGRGGDGGGDGGGGLQVTSNKRVFQEFCL